MSGEKFVYKCDRCNTKQKLVQDDIMEMLYYVDPFGCYEGDYTRHDHYFFYCKCNRPIEVHIDDITVNIYELPKIDRMHGQGRCGLK